MPDYDDPAVEEEWCQERRSEVEAYLRGQGVDHGRIGEWPAWHVAPYVSVWAIESKARPDWVGWWVICGDLPTDCISSAGAKCPREAVRAIAEEWLELAGYMERGELHPDSRLSRREDWPTLGPLLQRRAEMLLKYADLDGAWEEEDAEGDSG
jgi:hypothetical protein